MLPKRRMPKPLNIAISTAIGTASIFVLLAIVNGIIGNRADAIFLLMVDQVAKSLSASLWPWIVTLILLLVIPGIVLRWFQERKSLTYDLENLRYKLEGKDILVRLDDSLLRLLPSLISATDVDDEVHKLIKKVLRDVTKAFPKDIPRGSLFRPDAPGEYLTLWEFNGAMDDESRVRKKFYIGSARSDVKRGVAGEAFCAKELLVTRIEEVANECKWKANREYYICFEPDEDGTFIPYPPYRSFICAPIIVETACLGVLCFDSNNISIFDNAEVQEMIQLLSRRIGSVLLIYQKLQITSQKLQKQGS